ncbi:MAG: transposase [Clostridium sp.]|nr:transposase [Clostridium sp.]
MRNKLRRALWHNYRSPSFYMITLSKRKSAEVPLFSNLIKKENEEIDVAFSWSGWAIYNAISKFSKEFPFIKLGRYVIMPDHVHIIMQVTETTPEPFGFYVNRLKTISTQCFKSKSKPISPSEESIFEEGFNDRIYCAKTSLTFGAIM